MIIEWSAVALSTAILVVASFLPYVGLQRGSSSGGGGHAHHGDDGTRLTGISLSNCFAAGIFLGTCFLGLIPHVAVQERRLFELLNVTTDDLHQLHHHGAGPYPFLRTHFVILAGFLLILFFEQAVFIFMPKKHDHSALSDNDGLGGSGAEAHYHHRRKHSDHQSQPLVQLSDSDSDSLDEIQFRGTASFPAASEDETDDHGHGHGHHHHHVLPTDASPLEYVVLLGALAVHSIFEGIALGAQREFAAFMKFLLSVMLHEVLCSFAFGVNLVRQRVPLRKAVGSILFLSCSLPLGMAIMYSIGTFDDVPSLATRFVLEGLAAGIFVHVATIEMLANEMPHSPSKVGFVKALVVAAGAALFFVVNILLS